MDSPDRPSPPPSRIATTLLACLGALTCAGLVWAPRAAPDDDAIDAWVARARAAQADVLRRHDDPRGRTKALRALCAELRAELTRLAPPDAVDVIAGRVPLLGPDGAIADGARPDR